MSTDFQPDWTMPLSEYKRIQEQSMPKIKPLVWKRIHRGYQVAECTISVFEVWENSGESGCWIAKCLDKKAVEVATEAEAKAWCQAEYERRVRECLA